MDEGLELGADALRRARAAAGGSGRFGGGIVSRRDGQQDGSRDRGARNQLGGRRGRPGGMRPERWLPPAERPWSGAGPDAARDPQRLGVAASRLFKELGWDATIARSRVLDDWASLVSPTVAENCHPTSLRDGELRIEAVSSAWAFQLKLLIPVLLARLADEVGAGVVKRISISGPIAPSWKHGIRSVRGRGPRDTYG